MDDLRFPMGPVRAKNEDTASHRLRNSERGGLE
jgi:hypothetical protein